MVQPDDPYYNRKPVPKELIQDVGITGLTPQEEFHNRERKYSAADGSDIRSHSLKAIAAPGDPYYQRKRVSDAEISGVGITGLTPQEEFNNRERKFSAVDGTDIRSHSLKWVTKPGDPYYHRKKADTAETAGVADLSDTLTPAEQYEVRERKQSLFQISDDPFAALSGRHRGSIVDPGEIGAATAATQRRKSSALAPDAMRAAAAHHHSGYGGAEKLQPIESKPELPPISGATASETATSGTTAADSHATNGGQTTFYDQATDGIAPHDTSRNAAP